jgi:hypothetical protein
VDAGRGLTLASPPIPDLLPTVERGAAGAFAFVFAGARAAASRAQLVNEA